MSTAELKLTLFGTGSSGGVPRIGNNWGDCDPAEPRNHRTRCGAMFELIRPGAEDATRVLIDTSADLRVQLLAANVQRIDGVLVTHDHYDQTGGIDDLRVLAYIQQSRVPVHMSFETARTLIVRNKYCFEGAGGYPAILDQEPHLVPFEPRLIAGPSGQMSILPVLQEHGEIASLGFRVGPIAYCNDVSALSPEAIDALRGASIFVVDALRPAPHPSHAHLGQSLAWAAEINADRTVLTNMHIDMDYRTLTETLPASVEPGYDGMVISAPV